MRRDPHQLESEIFDEFEENARAVIFDGSCEKFLASIPDETIQLIVTSPPYNLGKTYEKRVHLDEYLKWQEQIIAECVRVLAPSGSICWQVGNFVINGEIIPLDIVLYPFFAKHGLKLRNRIVWHFEHGLHCSKRLSGRHETIMWFTKSEDYKFDLDKIRVPQKYPGKRHFKGPKAGQLSGNPLGKNPGDVWVFPNVKNNHVEKTVHPCQFPVELVDRLVLSLTDKNDWVLDPFLGVGTTVASAVLRGRRGCGSEKMKEYVEIARERVQKAIDGVLPVRPMNTPVYDPANAGKSLTHNSWTLVDDKDSWNQINLVEEVRVAGWSKSEDC
ncbi:DNA-methyltransferase [Polaromonas sp.]|uniref:DNA-methyltransferase n=1 Tax=Polaromonas sp. TaxID=1869339 RepID=UPI001A255BE0|nr:site-specific DNA-methyltransferase [Burkholderiales bacterium]